MRWGIVLAALCALAGARVDAAAWSDAARFEREALAALNFARADPASYAGTLRAYRTLFHDRVVRMPGRSADYETEEGVAPVDSAIAFLGHRPRQPPLDPSALLAAAAAELAVAERDSGAIGHGGGRLDPAARAARHGGGARIAEVIAYGPADGAEAIRQLIVDDGVAGRDHRSLLFTPGLRFAGAACGPHPAYGSMCVIELAATADAR